MLVKRWGISVFLILIVVTMTGCMKSADSLNSESQPWEESPLFQSNGYSMIGEEGRIGFLFDDSDVMRFKPNKVQKYMWHLWGDEQELNGKFKVVASPENGGEPVTVLEDLSLGSANNGADRHIPSQMSLPAKGMWKMDAYVGDSLFGTIFVQVHES
ncbi:DUF4871 domain-containing protein [Paenibacillus sp. FSL W8-0186]|uniref:DUF4871 domain-containing protein n=1 Tax=Paenibacillus sp. FSL W8-0186 TaxID=2921709 RepID=UPI001FCFD8D5|nr:DUF4871 domain-containing protein [Paenibacillus woosongensis]